MCTVQTTTAEMSEVLSWKDRVVASASGSVVASHPHRVSNSAHTNERRRPARQKRGASQIPSQTRNAKPQLSVSTKADASEVLMLHSKWTLYYHNPNSNDWSNSSYRRITQLSSVEAFCAYYKEMDFEECAHGMFFLMRGDIMPTWEDKHNKNGGCWSFKISLEHFFHVWKHLSILLVGESLSSVPLLLNGISVSPKRGFCIVKLWNHTTAYDKTDILKLADLQYLEDNGPALYTPFNTKK